MDIKNIKKFVNMIYSEGYSNLIFSEIFLCIWNRQQELECEESGQVHKDEMGWACDVDSKMSPITKSMFGLFKMNKKNLGPII